MSTARCAVRIACCATIAVMGVGASAPPRPVAQEPAQHGRTLGFMLRTLYYAVPPDPKACPAESEGSLEMFAQSLSPEEKARYGKPEDREKLIKLMNERLGFKILRLPQRLPMDDASEDKLAALRAQLGLPPGKGALISLGASYTYDSCSDPEDFPQFDHGNQTYLGAVSDGANLDGKVGKNDFVGVDGTKGVDNGLLRATGCNLGVKGTGDPKTGDKTLFSQTAPTALEISGVDDLRNDDDVTVRIYGAAQSLDVGADGDALRWASVDLDPNPRYTAEAKGRIVNGVLTTDPFAFTTRQKESVVEAYSSFVGTRLRIRFAPDGTIAGDLFGYQTLESLDYLFRHLSQNAANFSRTSCPALLGAIHHFADGYRDPKSGHYTAISTAYRFNGVPAFLVHPGAAPVRATVASAEGVK